MRIPNTVNEAMKKGFTMHVDLYSYDVRSGKNVWRYQVTFKNFFGECHYSRGKTLFKTASEAAERTLAAIERKKKKSKDGILKRKRDIGGRKIPLWKRRPPRHD